MVRDRYFRPKPIDRINKNRMTKYILVIFDSHVILSTYFLRATNYSGSNVPNAFAAHFDEKVKTITESCAIDQAVYDIRSYVFLVFWFSIYLVVWCNNWCFGFLFIWSSGFGLTVQLVWFSKQMKTSNV